MSLGADKILRLKCFRFNPPNFKNNINNLTGHYNDLFNYEDEDNFFLENKSNSFDLTSQYNITSDNGFYLDKNFGPVFIGDDLKILFILINQTNSEIRIEKLNIHIFSDELKELNNSIPFDCKIPSNFQIKKNSFYSFALFFNVDKNIKYKIDIKAYLFGNFFENNIFTQNEQKRIQERKGYEVLKRLTFDGKFPVNIKTIFNLVNCEKCFINQIINNPTFVKIKISNIWLNTINEPKKIIKLKYEFNETYLSNQEEISLLYIIDEPNIFNYEEKFELNIIWSRINDINRYHFKTNIINDNISFNKFFAIELKEKPNITLIKNQTFNVILILHPKLFKKINIKITCDNNDSGKVITILDIIEENIELINKSEEICLICKSKFIGNNIPFPTINFNVKYANKELNYPMKNILSFPISKEINLI